jgi:hypothetical protein
VRQLLIPVPSIAAGAGPFAVCDSPEGAGGCCAPPTQGKPGLFQSPYSVSSALALGIRAHEYGHLGLWRLRLEPSLRCIRNLHRTGIHEVWIQGLLDVVVNHFMMAQGNRDIAELVLWRGGLCSDLPRWIAANLYIRAEGLRHASLIRMSILARQTSLTGEDLVVLDESSKRLAQWGTEQLPLSRRKYREMLTRLQNRFGPDSANAEHPLAQVVMCVRLLEMECRETGEGLDPEDYSTGKGLWVPARVSLRVMSAGDTSVSWGSMDILAPALTHRCRNLPGIAKRKMVFGYTGAFRFPSRALLPAADGRAFGGRRAQSARHGTLLIDCSGSMSDQVSHDRLMAVLRRCPTATIGLYAGRPANESGSLLIAARNGMHVAREVIDNWAHAGNVVDGPALQWLSQQKSPRVWVSDGEVTGVNDRTAANLLRDVDILTSTARIRRVPTLDAFLEGDHRQENK